MNELSDKPLVERANGGIKDGNDRMTEKPWRMISEYKQIRGHVRQIMNNR